MAKGNDLKQYFAQCVAECFSTFMLILIGEGAIAQYKFTGKSEQSPIIINISFGIAVYTALVIAGPISGAHLNPAVSISLLTVRKLKPLQCLFYIIGQMIGAFLGALCVYFVYFGLFNKFDHGVRAVTGSTGTADIFFTMPAEGVEHWNSFFDQIIGTAILMIFIMALNAEYNRLISDVAKPFAFVLIIVGITSAFAGNCGAAINPARDLAPRIFAAFIYGWNDVFQVNNYFFWIPVVAPILGAIIGVWLFEAYAQITKHFMNLSTTDNIRSIELHSKVIQLDDENQAMISNKAIPVHT